MKQNQLFKSILEQDTAPIVVCDLEHTIVYMNPSAKARYHKDLTGNSVKNCHNATSCEMIDKVISWFGERENNNMMFIYHNEKENKDVYMVALRDDNGTLIGYYEKHEYRNRETNKSYDFNGGIK
ncbi:MAG: fatty acid/phospholipid synthesis protein PlsX [Ruminococcaceae bacterium]|nr:fatty acid/phospholipid synthesis protein PlsX [Oscillospiraceae bacterium]